ncbi:unconventional myosin-XVIIIa isoform X3 [Vespa velutina]|uniref:unconventional myosin-XVIIIa isoform X3 n=1 Tax=Vespa velutina TaxID=202808 RepID=UPI001FB261F8|nr:unconventional myosin-XVIIIa isoform X3 [Vespa velutina]
MLDNATKWMSSGSSRLLKAKSSPNISKMSPSNSKEVNSRSKNPSRLNESTTINNNNKTTSRVNRSTSRTPGKGEQTTTVRVATSPNVDISKTRGQILSKNRRAISESPIKITCSQKNDKKKAPVKSTVSSSSSSSSTSSSCTILEDRSLLKKGLTYAPAKLPKKPEALRKNLDRSISLMNVPKETNSLVVQIPNEKNKKDEPTKKRQSMNRSISMWNVQSSSKMEVYSNNQSKRNMPLSTMLCSRPSKIPLLAGRISNLGRSLADLSQVDRSGESTLFRLAKTNVVNVIEPDLDRSIDERIYENCREAIGERVLDKEESSSRIGTNLEERAARLMAELDDDDNDNGPTTMDRTDKGEIKEMIDSVDRVDGVDLENSEKSSKNREIPIFFRSGTLERLEAQRDEKLTGHIILLQARCRGYLARRKLNTLKLQDLAVRCIQRNVRKLMSVREWPWWRLYVKVAPLLNVHRTEDQLKARTEELEVLRAKVERLEQERNHLKHDNDKLEAKLSEMTADFAEEHSTSTLAAERIDAETSERLRLERELQDVTEANKNLQQTTERLEMELLYARAADLNGVASDGEDGEDGGVYRQRYEHAIRELEFTKRKMAQQHEDDLEQLVGLKKQLEKKLADAYEEVEEQRQVVGQWKRRVQKLNGEMHDLRLLLEEQTARNNLLEKKQRKFDSETQNLMNDLRQEKAQRERLAREKEITIAEKFTIEQNLSDAKLEIELKEERLRTLSQELEELTFGGKTEEEVAQLKKAKHELEKRAKDQEEELDDLAGQVQLLEQAKLRLEMSIEQQRKEMRKEMQQRDEELEDVRGNALKKVKALESQLENEHEERTILLREKHEFERRLVAIEEQDRADRAVDAETTQRLKRDLKRTRALLRDAQTMLERSKGDSTGKAALRQLKNQLEDAECARAAAVKAKQALEQELNETQATLEEATRLRSEAEDRANAANRERSELLSQLEENEEELAEVLKKYRAAVQQVSAEQAQLQEAQVQIAALEAEKSSLKDQLSELSQRLESVEQLGDPTANSLATRRLEFRTKELESKLELEQTTRARLETQIARLKESVEKLQTETALLRTKEQTAQDTARRLQRSLRDAREEASSALAREQEATRARRELEKSLEAAEAETKVARDDLRLALQRIDDLQSAIQGELDLDCSEEATSENSDSD